MAKQNRAKKGNIMKPQGITPTPIHADMKSISQSEYELFQKLKLSYDAKGDLDFSAFRTLCEDEIILDMEEKKGNAQKNLDNEIAVWEENLKSTLDNKYKELNAQILELKSQKRKLENEVQETEKEGRKKADQLNAINEQVTQSAEQIKKEAQEEAHVIVQNAVALAEKKNSEILSVIQGREAACEEREDKLRLEEIRIEEMEKSLRKKDKRLSQKEEIYDLASPEEVETLKRKLEIKEIHLKQIRDEYTVVQKQLNKLSIIEIQTDGKSIESLQRDNDQLMHRLEELDEKCNRFSEYELIEMQRAIKQEPELQTIIDERSREVSEKTLELTRLKNIKMEQEQLKSQVDLLHTLNDHLKRELEQSKSALESRVGEVCPSLTEIDINENDENGIGAKRKAEREIKRNGSINKTLPEIVNIVKDYAASRDVPLFYSARDIRAFIAGLASSKFSILQGLLGTGKTSLPKVFIEAINGEIDIVPVESSWRDRNELLGYYNDFNRKFTAKEFTCNLYRAGMPNYHDTTYFVVLDEMNLSRVEYYFADFLSVLEDTTDKWKIKLVDTDLRSLPTQLPQEVIEFIDNDANEHIKQLVKNFYDNSELNADNLSQKEKMEVISYISKLKYNNKGNGRGLLGGPQSLIDGNTIRIPQNVWFIGTANKDESTFEITDKVYDRAQVLNFTDRAKGERGKEISSAYIPYSRLKTLFGDAVKKHPFKADDNDIITKIDSYLKENFRVSFGNRITMQMDKFIPVYVAAGQSSKMKDDDLIREAIDYQLTNKVLRKLEYMQMSPENISELRDIFESEGLEMAAKFIDWKSKNEV